MSAAQRIGNEHEAAHEQPAPIDVTQHRKLIFRVIKDHSFGREGVRGSHEIDDLVQLGFLGCMRAAQSYDPAKGAWATYSWTWIRATIARGLADQSRMIRTPVHRREKRRRRGEQMDVTCYSLDVPLGGDGDTRLDMCSDPAAPPPDAEAVEGERARMVEAIMAEAQLSWRERAIIKRRFLTDGRGSRRGSARDDAADGESRSEIGVVLGCSRERVRQLELAALSKLRSAACRLGFEGSDL